MNYSKYITGKEFTGYDKPVIRNIYKLKANKGYWITDKNIYSTSSFYKNLSTTTPDYFGTVSDEKKIEIEALQEEERKEMELLQEESYGMGVSE